MLVPGLTALFSRNNFFLHWLMWKSVISFPCQVDILYTSMLLENKQMNEWRQLMLSHVAKSKYYPIIYVNRDVNNCIEIQYKIFECWLRGQELEKRFRKEHLDHLICDYYHPWTSLTQKTRRNWRTFTTLPPLPFKTVELGLVRFWVTSFLSVKQWKNWFKLVCYKAVESLRSVGQLVPKRLSLWIQILNPDLIAATS